MILTSCSKESVDQGIRQSAREKLKLSLLIGYGDNEDTNEILESIADAEGWKFASQEFSRLIETGNSNAPYIATTEILFRHPKSVDIFRQLTLTYIFDTYDFDWFPLLNSLVEFHLKDKKYKQIYLYRMWKGDWDFPPKKKM